MSKNEINIKLTRNESLVLFEFLRRIDEQEDLNIFVDQAEERVLWNIESKLEENLNEIFKKDYLDIIQKAREDVRDKE